MNPESAHDWYHPNPGPTAEDLPEFVVGTEDGIRLESRAEGRGRFHKNRTRPHSEWSTDLPDDPPDLVRAIVVRGTVCGAWTTTLGLTTTPAEGLAAVDRIAAEVLVLPLGGWWREAVSTALAGTWCEQLWQTGQLPATALGVLKAEARALHHQLVPVWRPGTRAGRVLSLDADLGGLSLYDLVAPDVDLLAGTTAGVFVDECLNRVLRGLNPVEQWVVVAYASREGTTWWRRLNATGIRPRSDASLGCDQGCRILDEIAAVALRSPTGWLREGPACRGRIEKRAYARPRLEGFAWLC
ncbi:hypothetical protein AQJ27_46290 [Streptomyces olivochromogenes]|nr:hypothetical protein AQJ27_46290 [Streptomyces olivochromogenes]